MPQPKNKYDRKHLLHLQQIQREIDAIYDEATKEAAMIGASVSDFNENKPFTFSDYPRTQKRMDKLVKKLSSSMQVCIVNGISSSWALANNKNNELVHHVFGNKVDELTEAQQSRYFATNDKAEEAFTKRKENGMNLSDRVWRYTDEFKEEIEMGIDLGLRDGQSAAQMARDLKQYLRHTDKLFRRVRDEHGMLHLSKRAKAFHPGQGVYRSSYMNARRLAATETNMAYRTADHLRWQQMDFVVGIEIHLSNNHTCLGRDGKPHEFHDICDELKGHYPKDFVFKGWHPHCRCFATTILKSEKEMREDTKKILRGEPVSDNSVNEVTDVPQQFHTWIDDNELRILQRASVPYFLRDNTKYTGIRPKYGSVGAVTGTKLGRSATKAAFKVYEDMPAPTLTKEVIDNTAQIAKEMGVTPRPMTFIEANEGRANISWGKGDEFEENCQSAVVVHEARLRGLDVTALGYDGDEESVSYQLGENFAMIWQHPKTGKTPKPTELRGKYFDEMVSKVEKTTKSIGRYHIGINMTNGEGHVITAERLPSGQMIYYDAQNGTFLNIEEYAERDVEYFEVLKVDKLLLRQELFTKISRKI